jgi:HTH-type transcriptional regulator/antitoxin MqsA
MKCPNCGAATLVHDIRDLPYACKGEATTISALTADWCPACGEAVMDVDESQRVAQALLKLNTHSRKAPSPQAVLRAVASSTAIETG